MLECARMFLSAISIGALRFNRDALRNQGRLTVVGLNTMRHEADVVMKAHPIFDEL